MTNIYLAQLAFDPQLNITILLTVLSGVFLRRIPRLLGAMVAVFVLASLFSDHPLVYAAGRLAALLLPVVLAIGGIVLGLRLILGLEQRGRRCDRCGCYGHCRHCSRP